MEQAEQTIRQFIIENFLFGDSSLQLGSDESFLDRRIIDSSGILELASFIEQTWQIKVEDSELVPENLDSIGAVVAYIKRKGSAANAAA